MKKTKKMLFALIGGLLCAAVIGFALFEAMVYYAPMFMSAQ